MQLARKKDFVYGSSQSSTKFYINTVPVWNPIEANLKDVSKEIRQVAINENKDLLVHTGGYKILKLKDKYGEPRKMYLLPDSKLPVPRYIWKYVHDPKNQKGITFITVNNPFEEFWDIDPIMLCKKNLCPEYGYGNQDWLDPAKGYTYCCDPSDLTNTIPTIPVLPVDGGILDSGKGSGETNYDETQIAWHCKLT